MGVIPNPKMVLIFPISCILALIFPIVIKYFPKCEEKGSFLKSQIKSLNFVIFQGGTDFLSPSVFRPWHASERRYLSEMFFSACGDHRTQSQVRL